MLVNLLIIVFIMLVFHFVWQKLKKKIEIKIKINFHQSEAGTKNDKKSFALFGYLSGQHGAVFPALSFRGLPAVSRVFFFFFSVMSDNNPILDLLFG